MKKVFLLVVLFLLANTAWSQDLRIPKRLKINCNLENAVDNALKCARGEKARVSKRLNDVTPCNKLRTKNEEIVQVLYKIEKDVYDAGTDSLAMTMDKPSDKMLESLSYRNFWLIKTNTKSLKTQSGFVVDSYDKNCNVVLICEKDQYT